MALIHYDQQEIGTHIPDLIMDEQVIVDGKVVSTIDENHTGQIIGRIGGNFKSGAFPCS